jgi:hypothetical protein
MNKNQLTQLGLITDAAFQAAQSKLAVEIQRESQLRESLKMLEVDQSARAAEISDRLDPAMQAGADVRWRGWIEQRRRLITSEMALCRAAQENLRAIAAQKFGRHQAALALNRAHAAQTKLEAIRRERYTS